MKRDIISGVLNVVADGDLKKKIQSNWDNFMENFEDLVVQVSSISDENTEDIGLSDFAKILGKKLEELSRIGKMIKKIKV